MAEQHQHKYSSSKYAVTQTTVLSYVYILGNKRMAIAGIMLRRSDAVEFGTV